MSAVCVFEGKLSGITRPIIKEGSTVIIQRTFFDLHFIKLATAIKAAVDGAFPFYEPAALEPLYNADGEQGVQQTDAGAGDLIP